MILTKRFFFTVCFMLILCFVGYYIFMPLYKANSIIIDYGITPFDICIEQPLIWKYCKYWFVFTYVFSSFFISNMFYHLLFRRKNFEENKKRISNRKTNSNSNKNQKIKYSLIDPKPPKKKLELLIR